jgi:hypothetical protein
MTTVGRNGKLRFRMGHPRRRLEDRLSELADYRKIHGHCNVRRIAENKVGKWVETKGRIQVAPGR